MFYVIFIQPTLKRWCFLLWKMCVHSSGFWIKKKLFTSTEKMENVGVQIQGGIFLIYCCSCKTKVSMISWSSFQFKVEVCGPWKYVFPYNKFEKQNLLGTIIYEGKWGKVQINQIENYTHNTDTHRKNCQFNQNLFVHTLPKTYIFNFIVGILYIL